MSSRAGYILSAIIQIDFLVEMLVASGIFIFLIKGWKGKWYIRYLAVLAGAIPGMYVILQKCYGFSTRIENFWAAYALCLTWFAAVLTITLLTNYFAGRISWSTALYITFWAYMAEHFASDCSIIFRMLGVLYRDSTVAGLGRTPVALMIQTCSYMAVYGGVILLFCRMRDRREESEMDLYLFMPMTVVLLGFGLGLSLYVKMRTFLQTIQFDQSLFLVSTIYDFLCVAFVFWVQIVAAKNRRLAVQIQVEQQLRERQKQHYQMSRDSIDLINQKCHHLKHQIQRLKGQHENEEWKTALQQLEQEIVIYNAIVKTGNDVLDVAINEKSLLCEKEQITLTCLIDGRALYAMDMLDVYELFSLLLELAMEKAGQIREQDRRIIAVTQRQQGSLFYVQLECYEEMDGREKEDDPDTVRLKRVRRIVGKYQGSIDISGKDGIWALRMMLRLTGEERDGRQLGK